MSLTIETKELLLTKLSLDIEEVELLTGKSRRYCQDLMKTCREEFNGRVGMLTNSISPESLCKALGTTIEHELNILYKARKGA